MCKEHEVEKLYLFGSVLTSKFNQESDIDFLVKFKSFDLVNYFKNYTTFKEKLMQLFNREVDLVEEQTLKNPILIQSINASKRIIFKSNA